MKVRIPKTKSEGSQENLQSKITRLTRQSENNSTTYAQIKSLDMLKTVSLDILKVFPLNIPKSKFHRHKKQKN